MHLDNFPSAVDLSQDLRLLLVFISCLVKKHSCSANLLFLLQEARIGCREQLYPPEIDSVVESVLKLNWDEALEVIR